MSRENVERIQRFYEHFNRAGEPDWDLFAPDAEIDATAIVGFGRYSLGRLRGTEDVVFNRFTHVWTFAGGKVLRWKTFTDRVEALEAAGLRS